jgi:hypothetical protein
VRAWPTATWGAAHVHGAGVARVRSACAAHGYAGRGPARPRSAQHTMAHGGAARGGGATLSYGGDLTGGRETTEKAWRGSPVRGRRRGMTRRRRRRRDVVSLDISVGGFGHGGDGSDWVTAASDSDGRDGGARGEAGRAAVGWR